MSFTPTPEGRKKLKELDEFFDRNRPFFQKLAESLAKKRKRQPSVQYKS